MINILFTIKSKSKFLVYKKKANCPSFRSGVESNFDFHMQEVSFST